MERRWRIGTAALSLALLASLAWGIGENRQRQMAETLLSAQYQRSLYDLVTHMENMEILLAKGLVTGSPQETVRVLSDTWRHAFSAQANLNQMPLEQATLMRTSTFLTQTGDFAFVVARNSAAGNAPGEEQLQTMEQLRQQAELVLQDLQQTLGQAAQGQIQWAELQRLANRRLGDTSPNAFQDGFDRVNQRLTNLPSLVYDGPFSDHIRQREPRGLSGPDVTGTEAQEIAAEFAPVGEGELDRVEHVGGAEGRIPAHRVRIHRPDGQTGLLSLDVSREGGHVIWMLDDRLVGPPSLPTGEAVDKAQEFLEGRGLLQMVPTFMSDLGDRVTVPFVREQAGVLIYPDLVRVTVALDTGSVIGFEAQDFLMAHHERDLPAPHLSEGEARERLNGRLEAQEGRLALIPKEDLQEVLTYEFQATRGEESYMVYINALTGDEEQIFRIVQTEEGSRPL